MCLSALRPFSSVLFCFFFNDTATTEIYTLSLHDALPISVYLWGRTFVARGWALTAAALSLCLPALAFTGFVMTERAAAVSARSEEHTSELQSLAYLVCRLLLEKKKTNTSRLPSTSTAPPP